MASIAEDLRGGSDVDIGDSLAVAALSLARRFARGGTLWCISPERPEHARHVAVEFVHPVLVGKPALPAVSIDAFDPSAALRPQVRSGDIVLAVSPSISASTLAVVRRAEAWGAMTIWIGTGQRPPDRAADHVLWVDDVVGAAGADAGGSDGGLAVHDGRMVLLYHLLWELTHVCFEHPGLLVDSAECEDAEVCITCSDEGRVGEVVAIDGSGLARVRTASGIEMVDTTIIEPVAAGDLVLIHAGTGIAVLP